MKPTGRVIRVVHLDATSEADLGRLVEEIPSADIVVMVVAAGADAAGAEAIGRVCSDRRIVTTSVVIHDRSATEEALSATLAQVRPWSLMVVVASDDDYVEDIVRSFR